VTKTDKTENFPVASLLLAPDVRESVLAFYKKARAYDDIADSATLSSAEKLVQLEGPEDSPYLNDLLIAFRQDAQQTRYETWDDLLTYCRYSAQPVGRFLLHVHGETGMEDASDALCSVLQILNHLQDCRKDYQDLNRIYLPLSFLKEQDETYDSLLSASHTGPLLRHIFDQCLSECDTLIEQARPLIPAIKNRRLRYQSRVTLLCAIALAGKLRKGDPLAHRVELTTLDKFLLACKGFYPL